MKLETKSMVSAHGSVKEWDTIWSKYSGDHDRSILFTRGIPRNIYQFWQRCYFEDLLKLVKPQPDWKLLELASGRATTSTYLASRGFHHITLLDLSETALQQARKNFAREQLPEPETVVGDAEATGLPANHYDLIYNIGVLEHFEDPSKILSESFRILKPGGAIFMPIVPDMPYRHSVLCRLLLNPKSLARKFAKVVIGRKDATSNNSMVRTDAGVSDYEHNAHAAGFDCVRCLPYNPYWKLYSDGSRFEEHLVIPLYRLLYSIKSIFGVNPCLKTWLSTSFCLLLTAMKPLNAKSSSE